MKRLLFCLTAIILFCVTSCRTGNFSSSGGQQELSYICVISSTNLAGKDVMVKVDDNTPFKARVQEAKQYTEKHNGTVYGIMPGRRKVEITYRGQVLYSQEVFVTSQQTKTITL
mgnify:CR=1 FL=1